MPAKSYYRQREDELKIIIATAKVKHDLTDEELAKKIGMPLNTLKKKKCHPGRLRVEQMWLIEQLAQR